MEMACGLIGAERLGQGHPAQYPRQRRRARLASPVRSARISSYADTRSG